MRRLIIGLNLLVLLGTAFGQESVARKWNEVLLEAIRNDLARPTVHARNLFHISAAMYDAWTVFEEGHDTYLLGNTLNEFVSDFNEFPFNISEAEDLQSKAISYAAFRLIEHRFKNSPGNSYIQSLSDSLHIALGYDPGFTSIDYQFGSAAALGNHIANEYINYGLLDGSNEENDYENSFYSSVNPYLDPEEPGNATIADPDRWQPLAFEIFIDQSGNEIPGSIPDFLGAEWGRVWLFSLSESQKVTGQTHLKVEYFFSEFGIKSCFEPSLSF